MAPTLLVDSSTRLEAPASRPPAKAFAEAERQLRNVADAFESAKLLARRASLAQRAGLKALARRDDEEAQRIASELGVGPASELSVLIMDYAAQVS